MMRVVKHWHRLLRELVDALALETLQVRLEGALSNPAPVEEVPAHGKEVGLDGL